MVLLHPHTVTAPSRDPRLNHPVPSGHLGTLRPREVRASQRGGPAISATQPGTFKQGHSVLGKKLGVSHQGWLRSPMGGGPPRGGHKGFLRVFCTMKPEKEEEPAICLSKTLGLGGAVKHTQAHYPPRLAQLESKELPRRRRPLPGWVASGR